MKNKKLIAIVAVILVAVIAVGIGFYAKSKPQTAEGDEKTITFSVVADGETEDFTIKTKAEFLSGALNEQKLIEGSEGAYGLFVTAVNGIEADSAKEEWWCFTKNGETLMTGVDTTPISDGEKFEATLTVGY